MPKLFVIMPFGIKAVAEDKSFDFDNVYRRIIRVAAERAGWSVSRIDELAIPGVISDQYLKEIVSADLVLADISIRNANVFYELGIRHAISSGGTILIAQTFTDIPFDLKTHRIIYYSPTISGAHDATRQITQVLNAAKETSFENPIRHFLETIGAATTPKTDPAAFENELNARIQRAKTVDQLLAVWYWAKNFSPLPITALFNLAERLANSSDWLTAIEVLRVGAKLRPNDFEIYRQLGWYLQQAGPEYDLESLASFNQALLLNPNDPETLGMMGGRLKRQGNFKEALEFYNRALKVSPNSIYILVNLAALNILANPETKESGIKLYKFLADFINKSRSTSPDEWSELVLGECYFALGDDRSAKTHYDSAILMASSPNSLFSAAKQLELLAGENFRKNEALAFSKLLKRNTEQGITAKNFDQVQTSDAPETDGRNLPILVHISDIHFGSITKDGSYKNMHRFYEGENSQTLSQHLINELNSKASKFHGLNSRFELIVSGDLTYNATKTEFDLAKNFLEEVSKEIGISKEQIHIIPGNHDINWAHSKADKTYRFDNYLSFLYEFFGEALCKKKYPRIKWPITLNQRPVSSDIISFYLNNDTNLLIVGFNSCVFENEQHHYGFIGERQLRIAKELIMESVTIPNLIRVAMIHHHLHPFPEMLNQRNDEQVWLDLSTIRDSGHVERYLEKLGFDIVLHGHKHKPQMRETLVRDPDPTLLKQDPRPLIVCGAGTISCTELEHNESNHYQIIELNRSRRIANAEFLRIVWRTMPVVAGAEWTTAKTWEILG